MSSTRRIGSEDAPNRGRLLDAAERLMLASGYAAVSSRRVAQEAGLKHQLVHYYFRTMDDLFVAVFRRRAESGLARQAELVEDDRPLHALWRFSSDPTDAALAEEFVALGNHRKAIRAEIATYARRFREGQLAVIERVMQERGVDLGAHPAVVVALGMTAVSRVLVMEADLGMDLGHAEIRRYVERVIDDLEGPAPEGWSGPPPDAKHSHSNSTGTRRGER